MIMNNYAYTLPFLAAVWITWYCERFVIAVIIYRSVVDNLVIGNKTEAWGYNWV